MDAINKILMYARQKRGSNLLEFLLFIEFALSHGYTFRNFLNEISRNKNGHEKEKIVHCIIT